MGAPSLDPGAILRRLPALREPTPTLAVLGFDRGGNVVLSYTVAAGVLNCADVEPERIFGPAARSRRVASIILADNRPQDEEGDDAFRRLKREGDICGVRLLARVKPKV